MYYHSKREPSRQSHSNTHHPVRAHNRVASFLAISAFLIASSTCTSIPEGIEPVRGVELERYLGTWYEIARLDHSFERGLSDVTATYSRLEDGGIRVINRGYDVDDSEWSEAEGKAYPVGEPDVGRLKVSFFGPFYGGYNIIELDKENYEYSLVAGPDRSYLWILARKTELDDDTLQRLVRKAESLGFPVEELIYVTHDRR